MKPLGLRVEHLSNAVLGLGVRRPRLSWQLPESVTRQVGYQLEVDGKALERVAGASSIRVPWPCESLTSRRRLQWRVRVWSDDRVSDWSDPAWFEMGLLEPTDWSASWIEPFEPDTRPAGERPAYVLATNFSLNDLRPPARLYATAHGVYEVFLNGHRVGSRELTPGFTSYLENLHVQVYDIGDLLVQGDNRWEVVLSDGWFRGRHGPSQSSDNYGDTVAFLGQLHSGDSVVTTGPDWQSATGPIRAADLMAGQVEDHRVVANEWRSVTVVNHGFHQLGYSPAPPTRRVQTLRPASVRQLASGHQLVDLGQNINGWVRLGALGPAGTTTTLVHGEALDMEGDVTLDHLTHGDLTVGQKDRVISAGREGDFFEPRHTVHGFQYVRVEGGAQRLTPDDLSGVVVHTDLRRTGWFLCSDERLNRLHDIAEWSFRDNACEIPTDCPTRERCGFTGDWQIFLPSAAFLFDVAGFSVKWLRDVAADQLPNGCITSFSPDPRRPNGVATWDLTWLGMLGSAGWGDAAVMVPWRLWQLYGDQDVLGELWPTMVRWLDFAAEAARTKRHPTRVEMRAEAAPHEQYLWDGGWHWGEWLEPTDGEEPFFRADQGHVATAFLHHSAALAGRIGRMLGEHADADRFEELAGNAREAWRIEYMRDDGSLIPDTQANHVRALAFHLVPDTRREQTANRLVQLIRNADTHLATGFLSTPYLLSELVDAGHTDVAYEVLLQDTPPSWLTMLKRGATTVWEDWEGIGDNGTAHDSLNHYSKGAVISFLHTRTVGIQPLDDEPAYRRFLIAPAPGGALTWAEGVHDSPYGRIKSSWRIDRDRFHLTTTVPPGTSAVIVLPDGTRYEQSPGFITHSCSMPSRAR